MSTTEGTVSSGNVFADLGLPDPEEHLIKADLSLHIRDEIRNRGWKQAHAAKALGCTQAEVSDVCRGRLRRFSTERLMRFLRRLGLEVVIDVVPAADGSRQPADPDTPTVAA